MRKRRIAVFIDWYLPGVKGGGPVRSVHAMTSLLRDLFDLTVITSSYDLGAEKPYSDIEPDRLTPADGVHLYYSSKRNLGYLEILRLVKQVRPDVVYLNSFWSYSYALKILILRRFGLIRARVVLAPRGMLGSGARALKQKKKDAFLVASKLLGLYRGLRFHSTQAGESADISKVFPDADIMEAPNINGAVPVPNTSVKHAGELQLFFFSRISRVKNLHFALEILLRVDPKYRIEYDIYGNVEDERYWEECRALISRMPSHVRVRYKGELPFHTVQQTLATYHALFLPTLNENFGHSIVESMMSGCLVIISDQTPWNEINDLGCYALPLSASDKFRDAIEICAGLNEEEFRDRSLRSIEYMRRKTDLEAAAARYQKLFNAPVHH